jgi:cell division protein ZapA
VVTIQKALVYNLQAFHGKIVWYIIEEASLLTEEKRRFKAEIAGKSYTIIGPGSTAHFQATTELLNQQLTQIQQLAPDLSLQDAAVLLAFNALSDQVKAKVAQQLEEDN